MILRGYNHPHYTLSTAHTALARSPHAWSLYRCHIWSYPFTLNKRALFISSFKSSSLCVERRILLKHSLLDIKLKDYSAPCLIHHDCDGLQARCLLLLLFVLAKRSPDSSGLFTKWYVNRRNGGAYCCRWSVHTFTPSPYSNGSRLQEVCLYACLLPWSL